MTNRTYLERYLAGEHEEVWRELHELGERVYEEPLRSDALAVCEEIVRRAHHNLRTLHDRLLALGYEFADPDAAFVEAGPEALAEVVRFEADFGELPMIVRTWYLKLASVDFRQAEWQLRHAEFRPPDDSPDFYGLGHQTSLVYQSLSRSREESAELAQEIAELRVIKEKALAEAIAEGEDTSDWVSQQPLEPCLLLGITASNCSPIAIPLPYKGVDTFLEDDSDENLFVDYLRAIYPWAGFGFWTWSLEKRDFFSPFVFTPKFEKLLPILKAGLLEL